MIITFKTSQVGRIRSGDSFCFHEGCDWQHDVDIIELTEETVQYRSSRMEGRSYRKDEYTIPVVDFLSKFGTSIAELQERNRTLEIL